MILALSLLENTDLLCLIPGKGEMFVPKELEKVVSEVDFVLFWDKDDFIWKTITGYL